MKYQTKKNVIRRTHTAIIAIFSSVYRNFNKPTTLEYPQTLRNTTTEETVEEKNISEQTKSPKTKLESSNIKQTKN
ncbi:hypothetical protein CWO85_03240 [Candidatus Phytoplasma ziziphi]|uniref:Uncharacterized protein n=1 Tax=Ziziphus jujuba witches'-broom phytoplasma TaxID=135727 RepID=A0A660HN66_ZIZJU|nr:hypothetical protein [Candidatus Phytoplasma ziziphi]AYJ01491.1 hypothetical protein CWO85_03240 [Candidatus Phytoplasma ziziphi]